jgi:hypothetical protein
MNQAFPFVMRAVLPESPAAVFRGRIGAELANGSIPPVCLHPATADRLYLPSRTLRCHECDGVTPDADPGPCASCGAADARGWSIWLDERAFVLVIARVCEACGTAGSAPVSWN